MYKHLKERIKQLAESNKSMIIDLRRYIHTNPELSFEEFETAKFIGKTLKDLHIEVQEGIANTGLIAIIKGNNPDKQTIALRADIDALPIQEQNNVAYKSQVKGVMHACGHDVHTASLIGTAKVLHALREEFEGTIKLIFQPAEEQSPGGAISMIREGVLRNPSPTSIIGQHVSPILPVGQVGFTKGTVMASTDELYITVKGKGGHAASPHLAVDPILIAAHLITALQQIVSRNSNPILPVVLSICQIHSGDATNIIPEEVHLAGTLRTINEQWRVQAHQKINDLIQGVTQAMGGTCIVDIQKGYPSTYNDPALTDRVMEVTKEYIGRENVIDMDLNMGGEDFAYYAQQIPGCFYLIGTKNEAKKIDSFVHTPTFDVDEGVLELGPGLMAWVALNELAAVS